MTLWQLGLVSGGSTQTFSGAEKFWFPVRKKNSSAAQQPIRLSFSSCCSRKLPMTIGCEAIKLASISASQGNLSATAKRCKMPWPPPDSAPALLLSSRSTYFRFHFTTRSLLDGRCFKQIGQTYQTFCQTKTSGAQWKHGNIMSLLGSHTATLFWSKTVQTGPPSNSVSPLRYKFKTPVARSSNTTVDGQNPAPPRMMIIPLFMGF